MPPKKTPAPIDRPLSRAYLRQFSGWSTAYPPGMSEPNSVRLMENVMVDRNGSMSVRPGLRNLTYEETPDVTPLNKMDYPGKALGWPVVGGPEVFYTNNGERALLIAVHTGGRVEFRAISMNNPYRTVFELTDPEIGFAILGGMQNLSFSASTRHVEFLQLDNKIVALSSAGESARLFHVGSHKIARAPSEITFPRWSDSNKLTVVHPGEPYINAAHTYRRNLVQNPSFEIGTLTWEVGSGAASMQYSDAYLGGRCMIVESVPLQVNMQPSPLHDATTYGWAGWEIAEGSDITLTTSGEWHILTGTGWTDCHEKVIENVGPDREYRLGIDVDPASTGTAVVRASAYSGNGALVGSRAVPLSEFTKVAGPYRWESPTIRTPDDTTTLRLSLGNSADGWVGFKDIMLTDSLTDMLDGDTGVDTFWTGPANRSASVYHPPQQVTVRSSALPHSYSDPIAGSIAIKPLGDQAEWELAIEEIDWKGGAWPRCYDEGTAVADDWTLLVTGEAAGLGKSDTEEARLRLRMILPRGLRVQVDAGLLEQNGTATPGEFFAGNSPAEPADPGPEVNHYWEGEPQFSISVQDTYPTPAVPPTAATPTASTLISSTAGSNVHRIGFFYTFEGDFGESAPSKTTEIAMQRDRDGWVLETPNTAAEPSGTATDDPLLAADQLVVTIPEYVLERALGEGALRANLYSFAWSEQAPVPTEAYLEDSIDLYADTIIALTPQSDSASRQFRVTARRTATDNVRILPVEGEDNDSVPPRASAGIVAADRMILVGDPTRAATIRWSSGEPGDYLNFSTYVGGGQKTLSTGNLNIPLTVELWQNPQSVDTLTVLCSDDNGKSRSYYMQPAQAASGSGGSATFLSFEETTNSPGTTAPYGAEVLNNALYRPISTELVKSTASNYNINHRSMTDDIENMWFLLQSKEWIMSAQLNNRLYYLVHNPMGETLRPYCVGNEVWVFDVAAKEGVWNRLLIQGSTIAPVRIGSRVYIGIGTDTGFYYLDPMHQQDDSTTGPSQPVTRMPIPWMFETNTQGANRAHDAWAHVQQLGITLGDFTGSMEYGIHGHTSNGRRVEFVKRVSDNGAPAPLGQSWDIEDFLQVRRDLKEWYFFARSVPDEIGVGKVSLVQYRYTPISVNVGYEYGSVETFEYGAPDSGYARNGIPLPYMDYNRP